VVIAARANPGYASHRAMITLFLTNLLSMRWARLFGLARSLAMALAPEIKHDCGGADAGQEILGHSWFSLSG